MCRMLMAVILVCSISIVFADTATQNNWSWGPGLWLQDFNWNGRFYNMSNVAYLDSSYIRLQTSGKISIYEGVDGPRGIHSEDIDGDGDKDILAAMQYGDAIIWYENIDGTGTSWMDHTVAGDLLSPVSVYSQDMDGDGDMDVLGVDKSNDCVAWWENIDGAGVNWTEHIIDENFPDPLSIYSNDINSDGYMDVLATGSAGYLSWWKNVDGSGLNWLEYPVDSLIGFSPSVYSEDINGDGNMDILGTSFSKNEVIWWENADDSGTVFIEHIVDDEYLFSPHSICSVDINGDGYMDILCAGVGEWDNNTNMVLGGVKWWQNGNGSGNYWIEREIDTSSGAVAIHSADLDDDGNMDVISTNYDDDNVQWYINEDGIGTQWKKSVLPSDIAPCDRSVYSGDLNGDGKPDILGSDYSSIVWWNLNDHVMEAWLESSCLFLGNDPGWGSIDWSDSEPAGTSVAFQVRACNSPDSTEMGAWSDTLYSPCSLAGILQEHDSYFQYRVILQTSDSSFTPVLEDVTITWDPVGMEGGEDCELHFFPVSPNPSSGFPVLRFSLPESGSVELSVFDLSGRIVEVVEEIEYSVGYHDVQLENLSPGIYFCRMTSGEYTSTQRFVVIEQL